MTLHDLARLLRSSLILILVTTVLGLAAAGVAILATPRVYEAKSLVYVDIALPDGADAEDLTAASDLAKFQTITFKALATSDLVLDGVIDDLGLDTTPAQLSRDITALAALDTAVIEITVDRSAPDEASDIANAIARSLVAKFSEGAHSSGTGPELALTQARTAVPPTSPVVPNAPLNLALGLFGGLVLGCGIAILRHGFSPRVLHASELDAVDGARVVEVPNLSRVAHDGQLRRLLAETPSRVVAPHDTWAEAAVSAMLSPVTDATPASAVVVVRRGSSFSRLHALLRELGNDGTAVSLVVLYTRPLLQPLGAKTPDAR